MTLFEILSNNQRVIVHSDAETGVIFTWNRSLTFQCWRLVSEGWNDAGIKTVETKPKNFEQARKVAVAWEQE